MNRQDNTSGRQGPWKTILGDLPKGSPSVPDRFLQELFQSACGADVSKSRQTEQQEEPYGGSRWVRGINGTETTGFRWTEETCVETTSLPMRITLETLGLPDMEMSWAYSLHKDGQFGYSQFEPGTIRVLFETAAAEALFQSVWQKVFGVNPEFGS